MTMIMMVSMTMIGVPKKLFTLLDFCVSSLRRGLPYRGFLVSRIAGSHIVASRLPIPPWSGLPYRGFPCRGIPNRSPPYRSTVSCFAGRPLRGLPYRDLPYRGLPYRGLLISRIVVPRILVLPKSPCKKLFATCLLQMGILLLCDPPHGACESQP